MPQDSILIADDERFVREVCARAAREDGYQITTVASGLEAVEAARNLVEAITAEVKLGRIYTGKVVSIREFGAFVEIAPETDGLLHVSEVSDRYLERVEDLLKVGDEVRVKVILIDDAGRIKLSRKQAMKEEGLSDPEPVGAAGGERGPRGGERRGGGGHRGGGDRGGRGGDRGGHRGGGRGPDRGPRSERPAPRDD